MVFMIWVPTGYGYTLFNVFYENWFDVITKLTYAFVPLYLNVVQRLVCIFFLTNTILLIDRLARSEF